VAFIWIIGQEECSTFGVRTKKVSTNMCGLRVYQSHWRNGEMLTKPQKEYQKEYYQKNKERKKAWREENKERLAEYKKQYRQENRERWHGVLIANGYHQCTYCNYDGSKRCMSVIEAHHVDTDLKEFEVGSFIAQKTCSSKNVDTLLAELERCIPLCANCHRETHAKERG
jgi:hypothetical protein